MTSVTARAKRLSALSEVLDDINLDLNWTISVSALVTQEVAIKKKSDELNVNCGEAEDFQKLASKLEQAYKERKLRPPLILLSISRSYRHVRAKLIHEGHKY